MYTVFEGTLSFYGKSTAPDFRWQLPYSITFSATPGSELTVAAKTHDSTTEKNSKKTKQASSKGGETGYVKRS